jgi:MFS family permease
MPISRNIRLLSWFNFFYGFRLYYVVAILYFAQVTGSYALAISLFSIVRLSQAILEIPTGIYSDKLGRSNCLKLGALASTLSIVFYALGHQYWVLVLGAVAEGACLALFSGNNDALLYESLDAAGMKDQYHAFMGKARSWLELAGFLGATLGGVVAFLSYSFLLWASVIPQLVALFLSLWFIEPKPHGEKLDSIFLHLSEAFAQYKLNSRLRGLSLASIIGDGVGGSNWSLQAAFYNSVLPVWAVGLVMSLNFLASVVSFRLSGAIINKFKALNVLIYDEIISRIIYFIALIFPTPGSPFMLAFASLTYGPTTTANNTLMQAEFTDKQRATMSSINSFLGSCFFAIFAILLGLVADRLGTAKAMLFGQVCLLPIIWIYVSIWRQNRARPAAQADLAGSG